MAEEQERDPLKIQIEALRANVERQQARAAAARKLAEDEAAAAAAASDEQNTESAEG